MQNVNVTSTDFSMSNAEYINHFWIHWAEGLVHEKETIKIVQQNTEKAKSVAASDLAKTILQDFEKMSKLEQKDAINAYNINMSNN